MFSFTKNLYEKLELGLNEVKASEFQVLRQTSKCIELCVEVIHELKAYIKKTPFKDSKDEIRFFKEIQPKFFCRFIFYTKVFTIEANRPTGSDKVQRKYLHNQLHRIKYFFDNNLEFYQYYRTGATHFDKVYFTLGQHDIKLLPDDLALAIDPEFCTIQSYKAAKLFANELLRIYINTALTEIERNPHSEISPRINKAQLKWTGSKVALIELIYALQSSHVLNNATADIKLISSLFESIFDIDLGNVYNVFQEMRLRKKNRTSFLDQLRERLIDRMNAADESY